MRTLSRTNKYQIIFIIINLICIKRTVDSAIDCSDEFAFHCKSGNECIDVADRCDGIPNCSDGSDETTMECIEKESSCRRYNFRCTYGACISKAVTCDNKNDCVDGSDELPALCDTAAWNTALKGRCPATQIQCRSGECLADDKLCDGVADCADSSDESLEFCSTNYCPKLSFRCGYGACVAGFAACNGKADCIDASDESPVMCNTTSNNNQLTTSTTTRKPTSPRPPTAIGPSKTCKIPNDRKNLIVRHGYTNTTINLDTDVPANFGVNFYCESGYTLKGSNNSICQGDNAWSKKVPKCLHFCTEKHPRSGFSTIADFEFNGFDVNFQHIFEPGTVAKVKCAFNFKKPTLLFPEKLTCRETGWHPQKYRCDMKCGEPVEQKTPFSKGGDNANITEVPWHVGIYEKTKGIYENICGGTLISPRRVVSAAHCFIKKQGQASIDVKNYKIAAGKYYRELNKEEQAQQVHDIKEVIIHDEYGGPGNGFYRDIAVIKLEEVMKFTEAISPACLYLAAEAKQYIHSDKLGQITAWSQISALANESTLQALHMKTVSYDACNATLYPNITLKEDKFCLTSLDGQGFACKGDSGSGFVFKDENKFYLYGIVSFSPSRTQECSRDKLLVITNALFYTNLLRREREEDMGNDVDLDSWNT